MLYAHVSILTPIGRHQTYAGSQMNNDERNVGKYLELAMLLPIATFVGGAMGWGLDKLFGTHFLYIVFGVLGSIAGMIQLIRDLSK